MQPSFYSAWPWPHDRGHIGHRARGTTIDDGVEYTISGTIESIKWEEFD